MIKHLVLVKFKPGITADDPRVQEVMARFERMPEQIETIRGWQVGLNFAERPFGSDWALCSDFENEAAFQAYLQHSVHIEAVKLWQKIATWTYCDFVYLMV